MKNNMENIKEMLESNIQILKKGISENQRQCLEITHEINSIRDKIVETPIWEPNVPLVERDVSEPTKNTDRAINYCPNCGNYVGLARFCTNCGKKVRE